jgi:hypothetical protein
VIVDDMEMSVICVSIFSFFVEWSSNKECSHQPPPPIWKQMQALKRVHTYQSSRRPCSFTFLQFL